MFDQITILLSFVFALALAHLLSSATDLIQGRDRLKFSGLLILWMLNALIGLTVNWLSIWQLHIVKQWTVTDVLLQLTPAVLQYFTCSLVSMRNEAGTPLDMRKFYARERAGLHKRLCGVDDRQPRPELRVSGQQRRDRRRGLGLGGPTRCDNARRSLNRRMGEACLAAMGCRPDDGRARNLFSGNVRHHRMT
jgi:hypothetical protein